jgi:hypothetical protein
MGQIERPNVHVEKINMDLGGPGGISTGNEGAAAQTRSINLESRKPGALKDSPSSDSNLM